MSATCEFGPFDKSKLGPRIVNYPEQRTIFLNQYFKAITGTNKPVVIDHLSGHSDSAKHLSLQGNKKINPRSVIGCIINKLSETLFQVFLNNVSYKKILRKPQEEFLSRQTFPFNCRNGP
jgi:hypothetical protein